MRQERPVHWGGRKDENSHEEAKPPQKSEQQGKANMQSQRTGQPLSKE
jgi:hypothetical protein